MITFESAINRLAERLADRREESRNVGLQRRNQVVDIHGMEFTRQGDGVKRPAIFHISISPDLIYFERFEFKVILESFRIPIIGIGGLQDEYVLVHESADDIYIETETLVTDEEEVQLEMEDIALEMNQASGEIEPAEHRHELEQKPHRHTIPAPIYKLPRHSHNTNRHNHEVIPGMTYVNTTATEFRILIEDYDLTPYFKAQHPNHWLNGENRIFPQPDINYNFDVLEAVGYMNKELRRKILSPGYKEIKIEGNGIFNATLVNYLKYSHVNR